jgi:AcrR family transcriptional regulator
LAVDTQSTIRGVATELFGRFGYEKTSLREIADRVGMTKASLYYHFPSKQSLLLAIVEPLISQWRAVVDRAQTLPHNDVNVRLILGEVLGVLLEHRAIARMFVHDAAAVIQAIGPLFSEFLELNMRLHDWLAGPEPTPADRIRAVAATEALSAALGWSPFLRDVTDDQIRVTLLDAASAVLQINRT